MTGAHTTGSRTDRPHTPGGPLRADTAQIRGFAGRAADLATHADTAVASADDAGRFDLGPVFGCLGRDLIASFDTAQGRHRDSLTALAGLLRDISDAAHATAGAYDEAEQRTAAALGTLRTDTNTRRDAR